MVRPNMNKYEVMFTKTMTFVFVATDESLVEAYDN